MDVVDRIIGSFPSVLTTESAALAGVFVTEGATLSPHSFGVRVGGETVAIPERLYTEQRQTPEGCDDLGSCLLTRHHNGFVRQRALQQVLWLDEPWAVPFIVRLVGEYVIEIIEQIDEAFALLSTESMGSFVASNPDFIRLTRARVTSYWDCYFRHTPRREHVGFRLMDRIEATNVR